MRLDLGTNTNTYVNEAQNLKKLMGLKSLKVYTPFIFEINVIKVEFYCPERFPISFREITINDALSLSLSF